MWESDGAHDMAHWLKMRYGVSDWKARRWIASAHALESLPLTSEAFSSGRLGVDKVVELTRFATRQTEGGLLPWAERVAPGTIKEKGNELARHQAGQAAVDLEADRSFDWWHDPDGRQLLFEGRLPSAEGRVVVSAVQRMMRRLPQVPAELSPSPGQRRADALVAICSAKVAADPDPDRATVVVHVPVGVLWGGEGLSGPAGDPALERRGPRWPRCRAPRRWGVRAGVCP